jgi:phenylpropionate dioxygenase-like ring-hydroxylating dioxygenase large terminal subunit
LWIWGGDADKADQALLPAAPTDKADSNDLFDVQFQMDLPYDQSYLIENIIDVAHIHIAHDGVRGGGKREAAKPLEFNLLESSIDGIKSTFRSMGLKRSNESPDIKGAQVQFVAPNLIRYASDYNQSDLIAGLDLYSIPLGKGRCRLLYRKYSNFTSWRERIKPRWVEHLTQCLILEQDMAVVIGQSEEIELADKELRDLWLPIKTSDRLVIEYRKWLDRFGGDMPFYQGFSTSKSGSQSREVKTDDRHALHTEICQSCSKLYSQLNIAIKASMAVAVGAFSLAVLNAASGNGGVFIAILLVSLGVIWLLTRLKSKL